MAEIRIEPFDKAKHQRAGFSCGKPALDEFIRTLVTQYEKRRLGKTFVAVRTDEGKSIVGYYTLASGVLAHERGGTGCRCRRREAQEELTEHGDPLIYLRMPPTQ